MRERELMSRWLDTYQELTKLEIVWLSQLENAQSQIKTYNLLLIGKEQDEASLCYKLMLTQAVQNKGWAIIQIQRIRDAMGELKSIKEKVVRWDKGLKADEDRNWKW